MASPRMAEVYEKLYKAVCNQNMNNVVAATHEIFGRPVLFVDEYFHVVSMYPSQAIGIPEWDEIYKNKAMNREQIFRTLDEFLSGKKAFYKPFYACTGSCAQSPRALCRGGTGQHGSRPHHCILGRRSPYRGGF